MDEQESIPIQGQYDVAVARNALRRKVAEQGWPPLFRARASAALTALAELILFAQASGAIDMDIVARGPKPGIRLSCHVRWPDSGYVWMEEASKRLVRATDEFEFIQGAESTCIVACVWLETG